MLLAVDNVQPDVYTDLYHQVQSALAHQHRLKLLSYNSQASSKSVRSVPHLDWATSSTPSFIETAYLFSVSTASLCMDASSFQHPDIPVGEPWAKKKKKSKKSEPQRQPEQPQPRTRNERLSPSLPPERHASPSSERSWNSAQGFAQGGRFTPMTTTTITAGKPPEANTSRPLWRFPISPRQTSFETRPQQPRQDRPSLQVPLKKKASSINSSTSSGYEASGDNISLNTVNSEYPLLSPYASNTSLSTERSTQTYPSAVSTPARDSRWMARVAGRNPNAVQEEQLRLQTPPIQPLVTATPSRNMAPLAPQPQKPLNRAFADNGDMALFAAATSGLSPDQPYPNLEKVALPPPVTTMSSSSSSIPQSIRSGSNISLPNPNPDYFVQPIPNTQYPQQYPETRPVPQSRHVVQERVTQGWVPSEPVGAAPPVQAPLQTGFLAQPQPRAPPLNTTRSGFEPGLIQPQQQQIPPKAPIKFEMPIIRPVSRPVSAIEDEDDAKALNDHLEQLHLLPLRRPAPWMNDENGSKSSINSTSISVDGDGGSSSGPWSALKTGPESGEISPLDENEPLPDYLQSQNEMASKRRLESAQRAQELQTRWQSSR